MRFIIVALALMAMFSTASATESNDCAVRNGDCSHDCRMAGSGSAVCSCPYNWFLRADGHNCERVDGTECKETTEVNLKDVSHNNLGGFGPDRGLPHAIIYDNALTLEDGTVTKLSVSAVEFYVPKNVKGNGVVKDGDLGMVAIKTGTDVTLKFELLHQETDEPITPIQSISLSVYDLDTQWTNTNAQESVRFCGANKFDVSQTTTLKVTEHKDGCTTFAAQEYGTSKDNPKNKAELSQKQMDHSVAAEFKETNHFFMKYHSTQSGISAVSRGIFFSLEAKFCSNSRCVNPMQRPESYLNIKPIMDSTKNPPGMYFQFNIAEAQNFFGTRPKWNYFGQHMMQNSCGEIKMITIIRNGENCDLHDEKLQCGRFTGDGALQHMPEPDWNYMDFDVNPTRWLSWVPGEQDRSRRCLDVVRPARALDIWPIMGDRAIEQAMYFSFDQKEAEKFFQTTPKWKYSTTAIEMINSCGEKETLTIIRNAKDCTTDKKKTECGRITGFRAGFDDWDYVHNESSENSRWIAFPEDVVFVNPEVSVGFGFGLFQKNCPNYNRHECCGKTDNRHFLFANRACVTARNGRFNSGHECEVAGWAEVNDRSNIGSCRICSNNPNGRVGSACMCGGNYCDPNQFCYNGRCNSAAQITNCHQNSNHRVSTTCKCGGQTCAAGNYCSNRQCVSSICCKAYTGSCLACAQGMSVADYCANNCNVPGCSAHCYVPIPTYHEWGSTCQELSNYYGVNHGKSWGCAPQAAKTWWGTNNCRTRPQTSINGGCSPAPTVVRSVQQNRAEAYVGRG